MLFFVLSFSRLTCASDLSIFGGWAGTESLKVGGQPISLDSFTLFGVRYEKGFLTVFGFENTLAYTTSGLVAKGEMTSRGLFYTGNLVVSIPAKKVVPFFTAGLGVLHKFGDSFPDVGSTFLTNYGFGVKMPKIVGPAGLRFDYRRFTLHDVLEESIKTNEVSGGVVFRF